MKLEIDEKCILKPRWYNNQKREYDNAMRRYEWLDILSQIKAHEASYSHEWNN